MRPNALLDLDDDDDFEALRAQALRDTGSTIDIRVTVEEDQSKVPSTSTPAVDRPQESVPVASRGAGPVTKKRKVALGDDATATYTTGWTEGPGDEPNSKAKGRKVKSPPKDAHSAVEPTQETLMQPSTEADSVTAVVKPNVEGERTDEPPKKKYKRAKEKVVTPSSGPTTAGAGLEAEEPLKSTEALKDSEASKPGGRARVAERPTNESPTSAIPSASIKKSAQPRKRKSQISLKSGDGGAGEERSPKSTKPKGTKKSTDKGTKSTSTSRAAEVVREDEIYSVSEPSLAYNGSAPRNDPSKSDHAGTAPFPASKKISRKKSGSGSRVNMPEKKSGGGDGTTADKSRVSDVSPSNPSLLDAEVWNELLQKLKMTASAQSETKKLVSVKKLKGSIASSATDSTTNHTPAQSTGLGSTEATCLTTHHGSIPTSHASPSNDSPCPACLQRPFHVLHHCPIVLKGPDIIQQRLEELRYSDARDSQELIEQLEALSRRHKDSDTTSTTHHSIPVEGSRGTDARSPAASSSPLQPFTLRDLPGDSHLADADGSTDEDSSAESTDGNEGRVALAQTLHPPKPSLTRASTSYGDDMLEAVVRGPAPRRVLSNVLKELQEEETQQQGLTLSSVDKDEEHPGSSPAISKGDGSPHGITCSGPTTRVAPKRTTPNRSKTGVSPEYHTDLHDDSDSSEFGPELAYPSDRYFPEPPLRIVDESDIVSQSTPKRSVKSDKLSIVAGLSTSQKAAGKPKVLNPETLPSPAFAPKNKSVRGNTETKMSTKAVEETPAAKSSIKGTTSGVTTNGHLVSTPSLVVWETMREPTPSVQFDELASSSPRVEEYLSPGNKTKAGRSGDGRKEILNGKERLFDLTPSQIPFPYSQYTPPQVLTPQLSEVDEDRVKAQPPKRPPQKSGNYRSLTALASEASSLFSSSRPTPRAATADDKASREDAADDTSDDDDSSSSETNDPTSTTHIPIGRRASSILPNKKKRGLLQGL
ncbi:hypothetical protein F5141DRAFT_1090215 [Pisolithus sp. B1]|nr:hypothetical protein F5141DRAFT_1090215 [Pisolithus sp. B1]